jgi:hypothetical protein
MKRATKKTIAIVPATMLLAMALPAPAFAVTSWSQGFESDTDGWLENDPAARIARVASGTAGITSASGSNHAVMTGEGMFTRFGSYAKEWDGTWTAEVDVYLDPAWNAGDGFDYSVAANGSDGNHQRDFIFHVTKDTSTGDLLVGASNNTNFDPREDLESLANHAMVTEAGWYTLRHTFYDDAGQLAVDLDLIDASGAVVFSETRSDSSDLIPEVGGNRYGWFTAMKGIELAVDSARINHSAGEAGRSYTTDFTGEAISKSYKHRWHKSGNYDAEIVTMDGDAKLRVSNAIASGSFGDQLFAPELAVAATEAIKDNAFNAAFTIEPTEYQEGLVVTISPDNGTGGRNGYLRIRHIDGSMSIDAIRWTEGGNNFEFVPVATGLAVDQSHTLRMQVVKWISETPKETNDVFRVKVGDGAWFEGDTFDKYYWANNNEVNHETRTLLFRVTSANADLAGKGLLIDDLSMSVSTVEKPRPVDPPVTPPVVTPPVVTPPVAPPVVTPPAPAATHAKVVASAKSQRSVLHVNVNPNKGSGFYRVKIQKQAVDGTWKTLTKTYRTKGSKETFTVDLPKGTYRAVVLPKYGFTAKGYSQSVKLVK